MMNAYEKQSRVNSLNPTRVGVITSPDAKKQGSVQKIAGGIMLGSGGPQYKKESADQDDFALNKSHTDLFDGREGDVFSEAEAELTEESVDGRRARNKDDFQGNAITRRISKAHNGYH